MKICMKYMKIMWLSHFYRFLNVGFQVRNLNLHDCEFIAPPCCPVVAGGAACVVVVAGGAACVVVVAIVGLSGQSSIPVTTTMIVLESSRIWFKCLLCNSHFSDPFLTPSKEIRDVSIRELRMLELPLLIF